MICTVLAAGVASAQTRDKRPASEPTAFNEDGDMFKRPVHVPASVLDALRSSEEAKSMKSELRGLDRDEFAQLFKAVVIHLGDPKEIDYVLISEFPLGGADAPWFWIVRYDQSHPKVIFFTFATGFEMLKTRNNGYPDLRSTANTASFGYTNIYHYDGQRYLLVHAYHKEIKPEP
jgi:hypothetical protein